MLHSVFFALMVGSPPTHPYWPRFYFRPPTTPASALPPPTPPLRIAECALRLLHSALAYTVYWKQPAWLHMPCPRVGAWT